jgi:UDP-N-acetylglucosamine diphosphorylase/glucosamine-1-phosphate N-acetyltransferase
MKSFFLMIKMLWGLLKKQSGKQFLDNNFSPKKLKSIKSKRIDIMLCRYLWDIIDHIGKNINNDKKYFAEEGKLSENLKFFERNSKNLINSQNILIGKVEIQPNVVMDATAGPIVIDDNVTIKSNTHLEGPLYVGCGSTISPLTYVKNSVIGPLCKIGGELNSVVIEGYTNKVHYGFLGNSYIGEWVNLGAGTSNSNLKNNYGKVRVQMNDEVFDTNRIHLGCFIGDFVKTSIGTKINTGSVYGSGSMIFSKDFPSKNIPILTWYTDNGMSKVSIDKFILNCQRMKKRRGVDFDIVEEQFYRNLFVQIEK